MGAEAREKKTGNGRDQKKDKKHEHRETSLELINFFEEGRAGKRRLRTADRILPSCKATRGQEGPPGEVIKTAI